MKCERCGKPATLHITEAREYTACGEAHLCEDCTKEYLYEAGPLTVEDCRPGPHNAEGEFPLDVARLIISELDDQQVIVFREVGGARTFPLVIGIFEATSIDRRLKGVPMPRPLTHDAWLASLTAVGVKILAVGIDSLTHHTYYASLRLLRPGSPDPVRVDIRPSDGVVMALTARVPIFIARSVMDEVTEG
jgi:bifunctional DNase/RNase